MILSYSENTMKTDNSALKRIAKAFIQVMDGQDSYDLKALTGLDDDQLAEVYKAYRLARALEEANLLKS